MREKNQNQQAQDRWPISSEINNVQRFSGCGYWNLALYTYMYLVNLCTVTVEW